MHADDLVRIRHMIGAAGSVARFVAGRRREDIDEDEMLRLALTRAVEIIGEAASHVSTETQEALSEIPWKEVIGMRHRLIHAYFDVDADILWKTAQDAVPTLLQQLQTVEHAGSE
ncbi:HepT-like ribonuclease domain-containing protein [uncultured Thiodictyon sp.]|uniref:HepT-like ribonuclease domain-containing protein n=1 Tax=uncultured Thiodictyon sp. TaxID=1846217 RepID=UPI0025FC94F2|nr:HepT-like ribonuclease domain-containing protein [uncultured Thiodictyon sp.]